MKCCRCRFRVLSGTELYDLVDTMDSLTVIPAIYHRKATLVAALIGIVLSFLATKCYSLTSGRTVQDMRNPRIATDKCGRQGVVSSVCNPDSVITFGEGMLLLLFVLRCCVVNQQ